MIHIQKESHLLQTMSVYSYVSQINSLGGNPGMTIGDQQGAIDTHYPFPNFAYRWIEYQDSSSTSPCSMSPGSSCACNQKSPGKEKAASRWAALELATNTLKKGDVLVVWSIDNFRDGTAARKDLSFSDVLQKVALIQELGASVYFVNERIDTSLASGRFNLRTLLAAQQYEYDLQQECKK